MSSRIPTSVSVSARITLNMHSLNNEGSEGNQLLTRMVYVVDANGELDAVNAVSGDMLKHVQAEHLHAIALEQGLPLCAGCRTFNANRINADTEFLTSLGDLKDSAEITDRMLRHCAVDDTEGVLITEGKRSTPRKSAIEFGWMVGLPDHTRTESYFHVKYDPGRGEGSGSETGANLGQNIFYRPASSGQYALVVNVDCRRVGWNDITRAPAIDEPERSRRTAALLQSLAYTVLQPRGAHRNTQHPHMTAAEGVVAVSYDSRPAPTASALNDQYREEVAAVAEQLNRLGGPGVEVLSFNSQAQFAEILTTLVAAVREGAA